MSDTITDPAAKLAHMAGQIADFFKAYPESEAVASIAEHINKFWGRQMRTDFLAAYKAGDARLHPLVSKAIPFVRSARAS